MKIKVVKSPKESLQYDRYPYDTVIYSYPYEDCKSVYEYALVYRGYIIAFGDEDGRNGGITTSYESGRLYNTLCWTRHRRPEFYEELKNYKIAPKDFSIDNAELEKQIEEAKRNEEMRQNEHRKDMLIRGLEIAKFALELELEKIKKEHP